MTLENLGYNFTFEQFRIDNKLEDFVVGRVVAEHKERYLIRTLNGDFEAEITGNMRFTATSRSDFPAVGDWVAAMVYDSDQAIIHRIFPRYSIIERQAVGKHGEAQIIATNIDFAFIVLAADRDFSLNRLERYLIICNASRVSPIVLLTKTDLIPIDQAAQFVENIKHRAPNIKCLSISNATGHGLDQLKNLIMEGKTYCLLGSSGVGKSTLINNLKGSHELKTGEISSSSQRGKHVTSHRELVILENGGMLIDNPGMREVGIADTTNGLDITFDIIIERSHHCKYSDCTHTNEIGCAVLYGLESGEIDKHAYNNFLKLEKEKQHFSASTADKRKKDKLFGKILKDYHKKDVKNKNI